MNPPSLGPGGEFDRIRGIWQRLGSRVQGAGDDCAIIEAGTERLALSTDLSIENVHFKLGWLTPEEIGWRATAAALSDLAAVAATPMGVLVSLGVSSEWPEEHVAMLMDGAGKAVEAVGAVVWGGDLTRNDKLVVNVTVIGRLDGEPVLRSGAQAGDDLWVTGTLGGPGAALAAWQRAEEPEATARERFVHPVPRVAEAKWLRDRGAKAMIDLSDGLAADVAHIAAASGVCCTIDADLVPTAGRDGWTVGRLDGWTAAEALTSGEEYELLVAMPPLSTSLAQEFQSRFGIPLTKVGDVTAGSGSRIIQNGNPIEVRGAFRHF